MHEVRTITNPVELRSQDDSPVAVGYAAVFGKRSHPLGGFVETVAPSAFDRFLGNEAPDVMALFNHDVSKVLGRSVSGTLRLETDEVGLRYEVDLPDTLTGNEVRTLLARGDIPGSSFKFKVTNAGEEWGETDEGYPLRTLTEVRLFDVGPVTSPAYPDSTTGLRSALTGLAEARSLDLDVLIEAARHDRLQGLLVPEANLRSDDEDAEARETPALRPFAARPETLR